MSAEPAREPFGRGPDPVAVALDAWKRVALAMHRLDEQLATDVGEYLAVRRKCRAAGLEVGLSELSRELQTVVSMMSGEPFWERDPVPLGPVTMLEDDD